MAVRLDRHARLDTAVSHSSTDFAVPHQIGPWYARAIDKPALTSPAHPLAWISALNTEQKAWLVGKLETQALYGTKVLVTGHWRGWAARDSSQPASQP